VCFKFRLPSSSWRTRLSVTVRRSAGFSGGWVDATVCSGSQMWGVAVATLQRTNRSTSAQEEAAAPVPLQLSARPHSTRDIPLPLLITNSASRSATQSIASSALPLFHCPRHTRFASTLRSAIDDAAKAQLTQKIRTGVIALACAPISVYQAQCRPLPTMGRLWPFLVCDPTPSKTCKLKSEHG
jgi:hypothetical protein